jgi:hypothetical protein
MWASFSVVDFSLDVPLVDTNVYAAAETVFGVDADV